MKLILSIALCVVLVSFVPKADATGNHNTPSPTPTQFSSTPTPAQEPDRRKEYLWGATAVSGIATASLRNKENGALWAFGGTVAAAALIESAQPGAFDGTNVWYAVGGAVLGTVGTCKLLLNKNFIGCRMDFK